MIRITIPLSETSSFSYQDDSKRSATSTTCLISRNCSLLRATARICYARFSLDNRGLDFCCTAPVKWSRLISAIEEEKSPGHEAALSPFLVRLRE
ncbi:hypothetical protein FOZ60_015414 [Perkinsus olseni]|uniref:Uncharacterized protein n=1 Tax=Perkinsus olseni TaxID=32597 RepID=A0A7J6N8C3_PEROL|nr:hypothetical protein FOZ60_015414 [Perkinsus olseni]